jgi:hypothetical protein
MAVYWDVALRSLIDIDRCFSGTYCLHHQRGNYMFGEKEWKDVDGIVLL